MLNYIKWELRDYFLNKSKFFIGIGIIYLLSAILTYDTDNFFIGLIHMGFSIIMFISIGFSFIIGTRRVVNTFKKKTFLLESMIPLSVNKILLAKFIIGFIINLIYSIIGIIGFAILLYKGVDINVFDFLVNISISLFTRICINYILGILAFMSVVMLGTIIVKVINPSGKGSKLIGYIFWIIFIYTISYLIIQTQLIANSELFLNISYIVLTTISFLASAWLIENKLEIYN